MTLRSVSHYAEIVAQGLWPAANINLKMQSSMLCICYRNYCLYRNLTMQSAITFDDAVTSVAVEVAMHGHCKLHILSMLLFNYFIDECINEISSLDVRCCLCL